MSLDVKDEGGTEKKMVNIIIMKFDLLILVNRFINAGDVNTGL